MVRDYSERRQPRTNAPPKRPAVWPYVLLILVLWCLPLWLVWHRLVSLSSWRKDYKAPAGCATACPPEKGRSSAFGGLNYHRELHLHPGYVRALADLHPREWLTTADVLQHPAEREQGTDGDRHKPAKRGTADCSAETCGYAVS